VYQTDIWGLNLTTQKEVYSLKYSTVQQHTLRHSTVAVQYNYRGLYSHILSELGWLSVLGLLWRLRPNEIEMKLCNVTRSLLDTLEEDTGVHSGFHMNGGLFMAANDTRLDEYRRLQTVSAHAWARINSNMGVAIDIK